MNTVKPESIALFCLTPGGVRLAKRLAAMLPLTCYTSEALQEEGLSPLTAALPALPAGVQQLFGADFYQRHRDCRAGAGPAGE